MVFNVKWAIVQPYHGEHKLIRWDDDDVRFVRDQLDRKSKKDRPHNDQKKKRQKNKQKHTIHYTEKIEQYKPH